MGVYCSALEKFALPDRRLRPAVRPWVGPPAKKAQAVRLRDESTNTVSAVTSPRERSSRGSLTYSGQLSALGPGVVQGVVQGMPADVPVVPLERAGCYRVPQHERPTFDFEPEEAPSPCSISLEGAREVPHDPLDIRGQVEPMHFSFPLDKNSKQWCLVSEA